MDAVRAAMAVVPEGFGGVGVENAVAGAAESRSTRPVMATPGDPTGRGQAGGMGQRRVLVHSSGFKMSPYSDIKPAGEETKSDGGLSRSLVPRSTPSPSQDVARRLWHRSPGSPG
jgi:error-prone DNA polymerase